MRKLLRKLGFIVVSLVFIFSLASCDIQGGDSFTITFDTKGGVSIEDLAVEWGTEPVIPTPIRPGYTFEGWYLDSACKNPLTKDYVFIDSVTIYAKWTINKYTITFMLDGENVYKEVKQDYSKTVSVDAPVKDNYTFIGWYLDTEYTNAFNGRVPSQDLTVYAKFIPNKVTVSFDGNGNSEYQSMSDVVLEWDNNIQLPKNTFSIAGYRFAGWSEVLNGEVVYADEANIASIPTNNSTLTLYAVWEALPYNVRFLSDNQLFHEYQGNYNEPIVLPEEDPTKLGYTFTGWHAYVLTSDENFVEGKYYYQRIDGKYQLATVVAGDVIEGTYYEYVIAPKSLLVPLNGITLYAGFVANNYQIVFDGNNATEGNMAKQAAKYDEQTNLIANSFSRIGYRFVSWNTALDGSGDTYYNEASVKNLVPSGEITLYAIWEANTYLLNFNGNTGFVASEEQSKEVVFDSPIGNMPIPTKEGYEFIGWFTEEEFGSLVTAETIVKFTEETTLYAHYKASTDIEYKVRYFLQNEELNAYVEAEDEMEVRYGETDSTITLTLASVKSFEGFTPNFDYENSRLSGVVKSDGSLVLRVFYTRNSYDVNFRSSLTNEIISEAKLTVLYNTSFNAPNALAKDGYTYVVKLNNKDYDFSSKVKGALTLDVIYTPNNYQVSFYKNSSDASGEMESLTFTYDEEQKLSKNLFTRTGYSFVGWALTASSDVAFADEELVSNLSTGENVSLYAVWSINQYKMTFVLNNGEEDVVLNQDYASLIERPSGLERLGYEFAGWNLNVPQTMPAEDTTFEALWDVINYTITYKLNGGNAENPTSYNIESEDITLVNPTKVGYTFLGWTGSYLEENTLVVTISSGSTGDRSYEAQFEANQYQVVFNKNNENATGEMDNQEFVYDVEKALSANQFALTGYTFQGWALSATGEVVHADKDKVLDLSAEQNGVVNLYAVWDENSYTVSYNKNDSRATGTMSGQGFTYEEEKALKANQFALAGYTFLGWATEPNGEVVFEDEDVVKQLTVYPHGSVALYAKWQLNAVSSALISGDTGTHTYKGSKYTISASVSHEAGLATNLDISWQKSTDNGENWINIENANDVNYSFINVIEEALYRYHYVYTNNGQSVEGYSEAKAVAITKASVTITADAKTKTYGSDDPVLTYNVSGLIGDDTLSGEIARVSGENVGEYDINQGTLAASANYDVTFVGAKLTINKKALTITAEAKAKVYGSVDPQLTYNVSGLVGEDEVSGELSREAGEDVGEYTINIGSLTAGSNYNVTFNSAKLVISKAQLLIVADTKSKVYGEVDPALTYQVVGLVGTDSLSGALARVAGENVGEYVITQGTLAASANYNVTFVGAKLTINKAELTITANNNTIIYGANPSDNGVTYNGFVLDDDENDLGGELSFEHQYQQYGNVGTYDITPKGLTSANYNITFVKGTLTVNQKAITITANAKTKTYGSNDPQFNYSVEGLVGNDQLTGALSRAEGENVGEYDILQGTLAASANYDVTYVGAKLTITAKALTITAEAKFKVYGEEDPALTYSVEGLVGSDSLTGALARVAGENVGEYNILQGTLAASTNYNVTYVGAKLTITAKALTITAEAKAKVYGEEDPALTYQVVGLVGSDSLTGALARVAGENVGEYDIIQGTLAASTNYDVTFVGAKLTINKAELTITANNNTIIYGANPSDNGVTYNGFVLEDDENDLGGELSFEHQYQQYGAVGTYDITPKGLTSANYNITFVKGTLTVNQKAVTITANAKIKTYGLNDPQFNYSVEGLVGNDQLTGALTRAEGENVGEYDILQGTLAASANYDVTYVKATLTITAKALTITATATSKVYGSEDPVLEYVVEGLVGTDTLTGALTRVAGENVGEYDILQGTLAASTNYNVTYVGAKLTITAKALTITAEAKTKVYGSEDPALEYTVEGLVGSDSLTGALARVAGENVGEYDILQGTLAATENYAVTFVGAKLTITKADLTITANNNAIIYGANPLDNGVTYNGFVLDDDENDLGGELSFEHQYQQYGNVGTYDITPKGLTSANYNITFVKGTLTVSQKALTITANAKTKTYGSNDPQFNYSVEGLVGNDQLTGALTRAEGENVGEYDILQGTLAASANYNVTFVGAKLTITAKALTITAEAKAKVYGEEDPALTYQVVGLVGSDSLTGALTRVAGENVGEYDILQGSLIASTNYNVTYVGAKLTITAKALTITAEAKAKVYGEEDPALTYQVVGLVGEDSLTGALARVAGENVGEYDILQGTLAAIENYAVTFVGAKLTINKADLTITANNNTIIYGANPADNGVSYNGFVLDDDENDLGGELSFEHQYQQYGNVGTYDITPKGLTSANYNITFVKGTLTVNQKAITITANAKTKTYGSNDPQFNYSVEGLVGNDQLTGALTRAEGENVGEYDILQGTLAASANYDVTYVGAKLTITAKALTITAEAKDKVYGSDDPALTYVVEGLVGSDALTGALTRTEGENVDEYDILQGTLAASTNYNVTFVGAKLTITAKALTITAEAKDKVYGSDDSALTYVVTGLVGSDSLTGALARVAGENVGEYNILQGTLAATENYAVTFVGAKLTINQKEVGLSWSNLSFTYDGSSHKPTATATNLVGTDSIGVTVTGEQTNAGTYTATASALTGEMVANYKLPAAVTQEFEINKVELTVSIANTSLTYGDPVLGSQAYALLVTVTGFVNSETASTALAYVAPRVSSEYVQYANVGTYQITLAEQGSATNYSFSTPSAATLTVNKKAANVAVDNKEINYGADAPEFTSTLSGFVNGDTPTINYSCDYIKNDSTNGRIGTYTVSATASHSNYEIVTPTAGTLTVIGSATYKANYEGDLADIVDTNSVLTARGVNTYTRTGFNLIGWNTLANGMGTTYAFGASIYETVTLYAMWEEKTYAISYDANGGSGSLSGATGTFNSSYVASSSVSAFEKVGYAYSAWEIYANDELQGTIDAGLEVSATNMNSYSSDATLDLVFKPLWVANTYELRLNTNYGTETESVVNATYDNNNLSGEILNPQQLEYTFAGWTITRNGDDILVNESGELQPNVAGYTDAGANWIRTEDVILYAKWIQKIAVTFNKGTDKVVSGMPSSQYYEKDDISDLALPASPSRVGYTFAGWFSLANGEGNQILAGFKVTNDGIKNNDEVQAAATNLIITLYAKWTANTYDVTLSAVDADNTYTTAISQTFDADMASVAVLPTRAGYTFTGFFLGDVKYINADGTSAKIWENASAETLTAKWTLDDPVVEVTNYVATYDGASHNLESQLNVSNPSNANITYSWTKAEQVVSGSVKDVLDSGTYQVRITFTDSDSQVSYKDVEVVVTISKAELTLTALDKSATYGDDAPIYEYQATGLQGTDTVSGIQYSCSYYKFADAGSYDINIDNSNMVLVNANNYQVSYVKGTLTVNKYALTITANEINKVYGEVDPTLTVSTTGLLPGDSLTGSLARESGENVGEYVITQGTLAASANYQVTFVAGTFEITTKTLTVTANSQTKVFGEDDPELTYGVIGLVGSDSLSGALTRAEGENVGTYAIGQGTLAASSNYTIDFTGANLTITAKTLTVTADAKSKVYGEADPELTYVVTGLVGTDSLTGALIRAEGENVGTFAISQGTLAASANYTISFTGANLAINKAELTITANNQTIIYGDEPTNNGVLYSGFVNEETNAVLGGTLAYEYNYDQFGNVGSYDITPKGLTSGNYNITFVKGTLTVNPKAATITANDASKVYGASDPTLSYVATGIVNNDPITGALARVTGENVGTYQINQGTLSAGNNYAIAFTAGTFTINQKEVGINWSNLAFTYDGSAHQPIAIATNLVGSDVCVVTVTGSQTNAGTYTATASALSNANYKLPTVNTEQFTIAKAALTITADAKAKVYGSSDPELTYVVTGLVGEETLTGALTRAEGENAGTYAISQGTLAASDNYTISFTGANLTINKAPLTITANTKVITYGDEPANAGVVYDGFVNNETSAVLGGTLTYEYNYEQFGNVGTYDITPKGLTSANYNITFVNGLLAVNQKALTITANNLSKVYGASDSTLSYVAEGIVNNDAIAGALTRESGENVGTYAISQGTLSAGNNYAITFTGATFTINQKEVGLDWSNLAFTFDGNAHLPSAEATGLVNDDACVVTVTGEQTNAGTYTATASALSNANYKLPTTNTQQFTIAKASVTVIVDAKEKTYGALDPELTYVVTGLVGEDSLTGALVRAEGENAGTYAISQGTLAASANYTISFTGANLTINKAELTITANNQTITYGDEPTNNGVSYSGFVGTENESVLGGSLAYEYNYDQFGNIGDYDITPKGLTSGNYNITFVKGTLTVNQKAVTITATDASKVYGASDPTLGYTQSGIVNNDPITGVLVRAEGENVGTYAISQGTLSAGNNYAITFTGATFTINQKEVGLDWSNLAFTYDGSAHLPSAEAIGLVGSDSCVVTVIGSQTNAGTYTATASALSNANYKLPTANTVEFTIAKVALTIKANNNTITYGDAPTNNGVSYSGFIGAEDESVLSGTLGYAYSYNQFDNVSGIYTITPNGLTSVNYNITYVAGILTVEQKEVGLDWSNLSFTYNGNGQLPEASATGLVNNDSCVVTVTGSQTNAGTYTATASALSNANYKLPTANTVEFTIAKALLTVTANDNTIVYGSAPANSGVSYSGFVNSETASQLDGTLSYQYSYTQYGNVGNDYTITPSGLTSDNYQITFVAGTLTVEQKELTLSWGVTSFTYNGQALKPNVLKSGVVNSDDVSVVVSGEQTNAGEYVATASLTGTKANNYKLPANSSQAFVINAKQLELFADNLSATYGSAAPELTFSVNGLVSGDTKESIITTLPTLSVSYSAGDNAGNYTITITGGATSSDNYIINARSNGTLNVEKILVNIAWSSSSIAYNGNPQKPTATISNKFGSDDVSLVVSGTGTVVGNNYVATASLDGSAKGNYLLPDDNTLTFAIVPATLTNVSVTQSGALTYNGNLQRATVVASATSADGNSATFTYCDSEEGTYTTLVPQFTDAGNHTVYYKATLANHETATGTIGVVIGQKVVELGWSSNEIHHTDTLRTPTAYVTSTISGDYCSVTTITTTAETNTIGSFIATATELSNPNYKLSDNVSDNQYAYIVYYEVSFSDGFNGSLSVSSARIHEVPYSLSSIVKTPNEGYHYNGWEVTVGSATVVEESITAISSDITIMAKWLGDTYQVSFDSNGGSNVSSKEVTYDQAYGTLTSPTRTGYQFVNWHLATVNGAVVDENTTVLTASNHTLVAEWQENTYTIHFNHGASNDEISGSMNDLVIKYSDTSKALTNIGFTRSGYTFVKWTVNGSQDEYNNGATINIGHLIDSDSAEITLVASWRVNVYTINFHSKFADQQGYVAVTGDITSMDSQELTYTSTNIGLNANEFVYVGYTFAGWSTTANGNKVFDDEADVAASLEDFKALIANGDASANLYAVWSASTNTEYKVKHYEQALDSTYSLFATDTLSGTTGATAHAVSNTYTGFTYDSNVAGTITSGTILRDGSLELALYYPRNSYTLTWNLAGGSLEEQQYSNGSILFGTSITVPSINPTKTGYSFAGWDTTLQTMPAENTTITATWNINQYTITYVLASNIARVYAITSDTTFAANKTYYQLNGDVFEVATVTAGNTISGLYYERMDANGQVVITDDYNSVVPSLIVKNDVHEFLGWDKVVWTNIPAENVEVYALWDSANKHRLTINIDGAAGKKYVDMEVAYGESLESFIHEKAGYDVEFLDENKNAYSLIGQTMPNEDLVLYVRYTVKQYTVSLDGVLFEYNNSTNIPYGTSITLPTPTNGNKVFIGWYFDQEGTGLGFLGGQPITITSSMTLYAVFTDTEYTIRFYDDAPEDGGNLIWSKSGVTSIDTVSFMDYIDDLETKIAAFEDIIGAVQYAFQVFMSNHNYGVINVVYYGMESQFNALKANNKLTYDEYGSYIDKITEIADDNSVISDWLLPNTPFLDVLMACQAAGSSNYTPLLTLTSPDTYFDNQISVAQNLLKGFAGAATGDAKAAAVNALLTNSTFMATHNGQVVLAAVALQTPSMQSNLVTLLQNTDFTSSVEGGIIAIIVDLQTKGTEYQTALGAVGNLPTDGDYASYANEINAVKAALSSGNPASEINDLFAKIHSLAQSSSDAYKAVMYITTINSDQSTEEQKASAQAALDALLEDDTFLATAEGNIIATIIAYQKAALAYQGVITAVSNIPETGDYAKYATQIAALKSAVTSDPTSAITGLITAFITNIIGTEISSLADEVQHQMRLSHQLMNQSTSDLLADTAFMATHEGKVVVAVAAMKDSTNTTLQTMLGGLLAADEDFLATPEGDIVKSIVDFKTDNSKYTELIALTTKGYTVYADQINAVALALQNSGDVSAKITDLVTALYMNVLNNQCVFKSDYNLMIDELYYDVVIPTMTGDTANVAKNIMGYIVYYSHLRAVAEGMIDTLPEALADWYTPEFIGLFASFSSDAGNGNRRDLILKACREQQMIFQYEYEKYYENAYYPSKAGYVFDQFSVSVDEENSTIDYYATWKPIQQTPENLRIESIANSYVVFTWDSNELATNGYRVKYVLNDDTNYVDVYDNKVLLEVHNDETLLVSVIALGNPEELTLSTVHNNVTVYSPTYVLNSSESDVFSYVHDVNENNFDVTGSSDYYYLDNIQHKFIFFASQYYSFGTSEPVLTQATNIAKISSANGKYQIETKATGTFTFKLVNAAGVESEEYTAEIKALPQSIITAGAFKEYQNNRANVDTENVKNNDSFIQVSDRGYSVGYSNSAYQNTKYTTTVGETYYYNGFYLDFLASTTSGINSEIDLEVTVSPEVDYYFDKENKVIYFDEEANGNTYTITVSPRADVDNEYINLTIPNAYKTKNLTCSFVVTVNDGVNVYTDAELKEYFGNLNIHTINLQNDIEAKLSTKMVGYYQYLIDADAAKSAGILGSGGGHYIGTVDNVKSICELNIKDGTAIMSASVTPRIWVECTSSDSDKLFRAKDGKYYKYSYNNGSYVDGALGIESCEYVAAYDSEGKYGGGTFRILNSQFDFYGGFQKIDLLPAHIYQRVVETDAEKLMANKDVTINGNYFNIDGSKLPYILSGQNVTAGNMTAAYQIQNVQIAIFGANYKSAKITYNTDGDNNNISVKETSMIPMTITYNDMSLEANDMDISAWLQNNTPSAVSIGEYMKLTSGGYIGLLVGQNWEYPDRPDYRMLNMNTNNVAIKNTLIGLYSKYGPNITANYTHIKQTWANSVFASGGGDNIIRNSWIETSGGGAIHPEDYYVLLIEGQAMNVSVNLDNTIVENWIDGSEQWFKAYNMASFALAAKTEINNGLKAAGFKVVQSMRDEYTGQYVDKMNLVSLGKLNSKTDGYAGNKNAIQTQYGAGDLQIDYSFTGYVHVQNGIYTNGQGKFYFIYQTDVAGMSMYLVLEAFPLS